MLNKDLYQFIATENNISMDFVEKAKARDEGVYLYGAGNHLPIMVSFLQRHRIKIDTILDTYRRGSYQGIPIVPFHEFLAQKPDQDSWFVVSAPSVCQSIVSTLSDHFPRENIFTFETSLYPRYIPDIKAYRNYLLQHWTELSGLYDSLEDEKSRETLISVLKGRVSGDLSYFFQCLDPDEYYVPGIIHFRAGEVMADLGANNGDTLLEFIERCPDFKCAYCFEPESSCLPQLDEIAKNVCRKGAILIISKGAWDCETTLRFCSDGNMAVDAHVASDSDVANSYIETATVDDTIKEPVTFIKMDIEGAEMHALRGASRQIRENRPKIAACVYHKAEDILDIWHFLRELVPEYRFYMRHHDECGTGTVLYAVTEA